MQKQYQKILDSENNKDYIGRKHKSIIGVQPSQGEYVDGLEMRNQFEDYFPCYRTGEKEHKYTQFANLDD